MKKTFVLSTEQAALLERLQQTRQKNHITIDMIAKALGSYHATIANQLNGKHALDIRVLLVISRLCPNVSAEWILRGDYDRNPDVEARLSRLEKMLENKE